MNQLSDDSSESSFMLRCGYPEKKTLLLRLASCLGMGPCENRGPTLMIAEEVAFAMDIPRRRFTNR